MVDLWQLLVKVSFTEPSVPLLFLMMASTSVVLAVMITMQWEFGM